MKKGTLYGFVFMKNGCSFGSGTGEVRHQNRRLLENLPFHLKHLFKPLAYTAAAYLALF